MILLKKDKKQTHKKKHNKLKDKRINTKKDIDHSFINYLRLFFN